MEFPVKVDLSESANQVVENLAGPATKTIGETLDDLIFLCLGGIGHAADKRRLKYSHNLVLFEEGLRSKVDAIPPEKLIEPDTQKVLGALDDAKFCVEHEDLRNMFENLIASSLSSDTADFVHPSFSGIVRRMSVLDAKVISLFAAQASFPVVEYRVFMGDSGFQPSQTNVFLPEVNGASFEEKASALQNLESAGLVRIAYDLFFNDPKVYDPFLKTSIYDRLSAAQTALSFIGFPEDQIPAAFEELKAKIQIKKVDFQKGKVDITDFGRRFLQSCGFEIKNLRIF